MFHDVDPLDSRLEGTLPGTATPCQAPITTPSTYFNMIHHKQMPTMPSSVYIPFFRTLPQNHESYVPTKELHTNILAYLNIRELLMLAATSSFNQSLVFDYIDQRKETLASYFFKNSDGFFQKLTEAGGVVSGSAALHLLLPAAMTNWMPSDLDLYVPRSGYAALETWIARQDYCISHVGARTGNTYLFSTMEQKLRFSNGLQSIEIIISKTEAVCAPIFHFHSTAVMNFFTAHGIFCAYPKLTLAYLSMVNPAPIYCEAFQLHNLDALHKYESRGFTYVSWKNDSGDEGRTSYESRRLTDTSCMAIQTTRTSSNPMDQQHLLHTSDVIDVEWCLGGRVSSSSLAFVYPRTKVVKNRS